MITIEKDAFFVVVYIWFSSVPDGVFVWIGQETQTSACSRDGNWDEAQSKNKESTEIYLYILDYWWKQ